MDQARLASVAGAFRSGAQTYAAMGSPLYAALCAGGADDADIVALAAHAQEGAQPVFHLMASVHYLLLRDPADPLARFFATLTDRPEPPDRAYPEFARYCHAHAAEIRRLLAERTVQTTYVERCAPLMPPLSLVADAAGEPLNLIEIGCSAGVLLTFDHYAYALKDGRHIGPADAPLILPADIEGGPPLRIPAIGTRTGIDLHIVDARSEEDRRWLLALSFPELRERQARLATALDIVARTDIDMVEGDALAVLPAILAKTPDPVSVFHSACLYYWSAEAKAALDALLIQASVGREIWRVSLEGSERFLAFHKGRADRPSGAQPSGDVIVTRYRDGASEPRIVAETWLSGTFKWLDAG